MKRLVFTKNKDILIKMDTRSQSKYNNSALYKVEIDFDEASEAWKQNKISIGNGSYRYLCKKRGIRNNICVKKCVQGQEYCRVHLKMCKEGKL
jgi:hypothetical protein